MEEETAGVPAVGHRMAVAVLAMVEEAVATVEAVVATAEAVVATAEEAVAASTHGAAATIWTAWRSPRRISATCERCRWCRAMSEVVPRHAGGVRPSRDVKPCWKCLCLSCWTALRLQCPLQAKL